MSKEGKAYKYDVSVPLSQFKNVVDTTRDHLRSKGLLHADAVKHVVGYGHVGDGEPGYFVQWVTLSTERVGNLHLNVVAAKYSPEIEAALEPFIYELVGEAVILLR